MLSCKCLPFYKPRDGNLHELRDEVIADLLRGQCLGRLQQVRPADVFKKNSRTEVLPGSILARALKAGSRRGCTASKSPFIPGVPNITLLDPCRSVSYISGSLDIPFCPESPPSLQGVTTDPAGIVLQKRCPHNILLLSSLRTQKCIERGSTCS